MLAFRFVNLNKKIIALRRVSINVSQISCRMHALLIIFSTFAQHVLNFYAPIKKSLVLLLSAHVYIHPKVIFIVLFMTPTCSGVLEIPMILITRHLFGNLVISENIKVVSNR